MLDNDDDLDNGFAMHAVLDDPSHGIVDSSDISILPILGYEIYKHYLRETYSHSIEVLIICEDYYYYYYYFFS